MAVKSQEISGVIDFERRISTIEVRVAASWVATSIKQIGDKAVGKVTWW